MQLRDFNKMGKAEVEAELFKCCGSKAWASRIAALRPFADAAELYDAAGDMWDALPQSDWLEAFAQHPRIGDLKNLSSKWAAQEQSGVAKASEATLKALAEGNAAYEAKFGHVFLVCATGKSADEMLAILSKRLKNSADVELKVAANEQAKITRLRLEKLLSKS